MAKRGNSTRSQNGGFELAFTPFSLDTANSESIFENRKDSSTDKATSPSNRPTITLSSLSADGNRINSSLWQMNENDDTLLSDNLAQVHAELKKLKTQISLQSKENYLLEKDVHSLDSRIALLIHNQLSLLSKEDKFVSSENTNDETADVDETSCIFDSRKKELYGNLFYILQSQPKFIARLTLSASLADVDNILQTVMFSLYGNQYEAREEHLLLSVFQIVLKEQFEAGSDFGSLLRANTAISRMMTTYTRRGPGQSVLRTILKDILIEIAQENENLEIDPLKVLQNSTSSSSLGSQSNENVSDERNDVTSSVEYRTRKLNSIANRFLDSIIGFIDSFPYGIRWICRQIQQLTLKHYPDVGTTGIHSLIGGFLMLRFLNPAIVSPEAYLLLGDNGSTVQKNTKRTLTLVAKMIQTLVNNASYSKEEYMKPLMSLFIETNATRLGSFFEQLCEVEDFYDSLEIDQYMAMSRGDLALQISMNEILGMHSLLLKYKTKVILNEADQQFSTILNELGPPLSLLPRAANRTTSLRLHSRWSSPMDIINAGRNASDSCKSPSELIYHQTKSSLMILLRSIPDLASGSNFSIENLLNYFLKSSQSLKSDKFEELQALAARIKDNLTVLEAIGIISSLNSYENLTQDILNEFKQINTQIEKGNLELKSLQAVYDVLKTHNESLHAQYETYMSFLENTRNQIGSKSTRSAFQHSSNDDSSSMMQPASSTYLHSKKNNALPAKSVSYSYNSLEKQGIVLNSNIPEGRRDNLYVKLTSHRPGSYSFSLFYKGKPSLIHETIFTLDELLEKQQNSIEFFDIGYVQINLKKFTGFILKHFFKK